MLETLNDWNIYECIAFGFFASLIVIVCVSLMWLHFNVKKRTGTSIEVEDAKKKSAAKFKQYKEDNPLPLSKCIDVDLKHDVVMAKKK